MENIQQSVTEHPFEDRIMRRIYRAWFVRRLIRNSAKVVILFALAVFARNDIWYARVLENVRGMQFSFSNLFQYAGHAFLNTEFFVQVAALAGIGFAAAILYDAGRTAGRLWTMFAASRRVRRVNA